MRLKKFLLLIAVAGFVKAIINSFSYREDGNYKFLTVYQNKEYHTYCSYKKEEKIICVSASGKTRADSIRNAKLEAIKVGAFDTLSLNVKRIEEITKHV